MPWATIGIRKDHLNRKFLSLAVVIIILGASVFAVFLLFQQNRISPEPTDTPSTEGGTVSINEIHFNETLTVNEEFFELYIQTWKSGMSIDGWYVTTFDGEGMLSLPSIANLDEEDYIAIFSGEGEDDLDAIDGTAKVFLNLPNRILDPSGDEIGLFDREGHVIDFIRYEGGNGDAIYSGWQEANMGPHLPDNHTGSISLFGYDSSNASKWLESLPSPGRPNVYSFFDSETGYTVTITNGLHQLFSFNGIDDSLIAGKGEKVDAYPKGGVDEKYIKEIKKHIAFSLDFYHKKGFTRGPATYKPGKINVTLLNSTTTETVGAASTRGHIVIKIGTIKSDVDLKYVCEHELMHLFQFKTEKKGNDTVDHAPVGNKFWIEGQATYWGVESTRANYNLTHKEIQDEFKRVGDHNWHEHYTDLNRSIFKGWGGGYSDYMGSYLFNKFIAEKFGEDKLKQIFDTAQDNFNNNSRDVSPKEAITLVLGKTWEQVLAEFHAWMLTDAIEDNGVPERKGHVNVTYNNDTIGDSIKVGSYAAGVERIKVNSSQPFKIKLNAQAGSKWKITIIYVYEDGTRKQMIGSPYDHGSSYPHIAVNPEGHEKKLVEVIVIKSHVEDSVARINMTVSPIPRPGPVQITPNGGPYFFELPWGMGNSTRLNWPWEVFWNFSYYQDNLNYTLRINHTSVRSDSAFNITIESPNATVFEETGIYGNGQILVYFDPEYTWPFGEYKITVAQYNWTSEVNGTIEILEGWRDGAAADYPIVIVPDEPHEINNELWRTPESIWYNLTLVPDFDYTLFLEIDAGYETEADWYIEVYNSTNLESPISSNEGEYSDGEWPRELLLPRFFEEEYPCDGFALLKVILSGSSSAAIGQLTVLEQPISGSSIDNPLWYNPNTTEYFGIPLPYSIHEMGLLFINTTLTSGKMYSTQFNCSEQITAELWNGENWLLFEYDNPSDFYNVTYEAISEVICIRFDVAPSPESVLFYMLTEVST